MSSAGSLDGIRAAAIRLITPGNPSKLKLKRIILIAAAFFLLGGLVMAVRQQPISLTDLNWLPAFLAIAVGIPLTICFNAADYMLTGRFLGHMICFSRALEVSVIGMAANMLPLPGSTLVRIAGLRSEGAGFRNATFAVLVVGALWIAVSLAYTGVAVLIVSPHLAGVVFIALGFVILVPSVLALQRASRGSGLAFRLLGAKLVLIFADAARLYWCLGALGIVSTFAQASGLAFSGAIGSMVSIIPAGLGIREAAAAALSPVVGLTVASGFLAATLNRVLGLATLVPLAALLATRVRLREQAEQLDAD